MKAYSTLSLEDVKDIFEGLRINTLLFDDIEFHINCINQDRENLMQETDTAYHIFELITLLTTLEIYKNEKDT